MNINDKQELLQFYRNFLLDDILPYWMKVGPDPEYGGLLNCIQDDGKLITDDKYIWSQARAVWTFSAIYNRIERRQECLDFAINIKDFLLSILRDKNGDWPYSVERDGNPKEGTVSIYSDCFVVYGFSELYRATRDQQTLDVAMQTYERIIERISDPAFDAVAPYKRPEGWNLHALNMIMLEVTQELAHTTNDNELREKAADFMCVIMDKFVKREYEALFEHLDGDFEVLSHPDGGILNPGHMIESMWFVLHQALRRNDRVLMRCASDVVRWALEKGWDEEHGGLFHGIDATGGECTFPNWDKKLWWPHTEALYALILLQNQIAPKWVPAWYEKIHEYSFRVFPDHENGEWHQRLDRENNIITEVVALPVKDPFHLPRAVILAIKCLENQVQKITSRIAKKD